MGIKGVEESITPLNAPTLKELEQAKDRERAERLCLYYRLPLTEKYIKAFSGFNWDERESSAPGDLDPSVFDEEYPIPPKRRLIMVMPPIQGLK